jgi:hypothetical protein
MTEGKNAVEQRVVVKIYIYRFSFKIVGGLLRAVVVDEM